MDNFQIADLFSLLSKLMDIHGENSFKSKSYSSAAFAIEKSELQLADIPLEKIAGLKGIGTSTFEKIKEILQTGQLKALQEIIFKTPPGVIEMLNIKGIGPKKINTIWKEMEIESVGELLYACRENRLKLYKGFGEKTQQSIIETIEFYLKNKESHLYSQVEIMAEQTTSFLKKLFGENNVQITGEFKRQLEIINTLDFVITADKDDITDKLKSIPGFIYEDADSDTISYKTSAGIQVKFYPATQLDVIEKLVSTSSSETFFQAYKNEFKSVDFSKSKDEADYFQKAKLPYIPAFVREYPEIILKARQGGLPDFIKVSDIKGIIHSHSNWSDGSHTIEEMARAAILKGHEYLVISDHSKSAFYANGLTEDRIKQQHIYIDQLNRELAPFRIFKSIESDILNDGNLDYSNNILSTFDLVITSVHSNLKMTEEKAMNRLMTAIENPYTTILGHMTGRLLLSRNGYPLDHKKIIDACIANDVVIELNAHPNRLDMDWRHISYALEKNALVSIDPDAHFIEGFDDIHYGVLVAQKALLTKKSNLSSFSLPEFENYLENRKAKKNI